jgi:hypothetical protein
MCPHACAAPLVRALLQASEVSQAEAVDGGLPELLRRVSEASIVLGDGGLQADLDYDRLAAAGGARRGGGVQHSGCHAPGI